MLPRETLPSLHPITKGTLSLLIPSLAKLLGLSDLAAKSTRAAYYFLARCVKNVFSPIQKVPKSYVSRWVTRGDV